MNDAEQSAPAVFNGQRVEDVVRRLHIIDRFAALTGAHALLALEMERDFVFGIMREDRANECMALYDFIFREIDFASSSAAGQRRAADQAE